MPWPDSCGTDPSQAGRPGIEGPNQVWQMDFMPDALFDGWAFPIFMIVDRRSRESWAIVPRICISAYQVTVVLDRLIQKQGVPKAIRGDNGPEMTGRALYSWVNRGELDFPRPEKQQTKLFSRLLTRASGMPGYLVVPVHGRRLGEHQNLVERPQGPSAAHEPEECDGAGSSQNKVDALEKLYGPWDDEGGKSGGLRAPNLRLFGPWDPSLGHIRFALVAAHALSLRHAGQPAVR